MAQIEALVADTQKQLGTSPFVTNNPCVLSSTAAANVYGANKAPKQDQDKYLTFEGDGSTTVWDEDDFPVLAGMHVDGAGTLATADQLRVVVLINGVIQKRLASGASPSTGEFKTSTVSTKETLTFGAAPADGAKIEVYKLLAADITQYTGGALTADRRYEVDANDFVVSDDVAYFERLTR